MLPLEAVNVPPHAAVRTMIKQSRTNTKYSFFLTYKEDEDATEKVFLLSFFITLINILLDIKPSRSHSYFDIFFKRM